MTITTSQRFVVDTPLPNSEESKNASAFLYLNLRSKRFKVPLDPTSWASIHLPHSNEAAVLEYCNLAIFLLSYVYLQHGSLSPLDWGDSVVDDRAHLTHFLGMFQETLPGLVMASLGLTSGMVSVPEDLRGDHFDPRIPYSSRASMNIHSEKNIPRFRSVSSLIQSSYWLTRSSSQLTLMHEALKVILPQCGEALAIQHGRQDFESLMSTGLILHPFPKGRGTAKMLYGAILHNAIHYRIPKFVILDGSDRHLIAEAERIAQSTGGRLGYLDRYWEPVSRSQLVCDPCLASSKEESTLDRLENFLGEFPVPLWKPLTVEPDWALLQKQDKHPLLFLPENLDGLSAVSTSSSIDESQGRTGLWLEAYLDAQHNSKPP